jgi:hypothetical protein
MFDVVSKIANHPSDTFTLLGETLPKMAGFFCNYVMIRSMSGLSLELIRAFSFVPAFIRFLTSRDQTPRDRRRIMCGMRAYHDPGPFNYGKVRPALRGVNNWPRVSNITTVLPSCRSLLKTYWCSHFA